MPYHAISWAIVATALGATPKPSCADEPVAPAEQRWGEAIRAFVEADQREPPPSRGILFVGSSSIRLWDLQEHFPDLPVINRGFGGSQVSDTLHFVDRIVLPYNPRIVVLYAGDNDIAAGESPEQVAQDFAQLAATVHGELPKTRIIFIAIKPSIARWSLYPKMREANERIESLCQADDRLTFVDIATPMLDEEGQPREELFADDGLHLNERGYELWTKLIKQHLDAEWHVAPRRETSDGNSREPD